MGIILAISLLINAIGDALTGHLLSQMITGTRAASRLQAAGAVTSTLAILIFAMVAFLPTAWRLWAAVLSLFAFRIVYCLYDVPQNAIIAFETHTESERANLSALRYIFSGFANLFVASAFVPMLQGQPLPVMAHNFVLLAGAMGLIATTSAVGLFLAGRGRPQGREVAKTEHISSTTTALWRSVWPVMAASLILSLATSVFTRLEPYFSSFVLISRADGFSLMTCVALGTLLSQPIWAFMAGQWSPGRIQVIAGLTLIAGAGLFFLTARNGTYSAGLSGFVYGFGFGGFTMLIWARMARICEDWPGETTRLFGLFTFCSKVGLALSIFGLGLLMQYFDYRHMAGALAALMALIPTLGVGACLVLMIRRSTVKQSL